MAENGSDGSDGSGAKGNTRMAPSHWWVFTVNDFSEDDVEWFHGSNGSGVWTKLVFQIEKGETGNVHLQGVMRFKKKIRKPTKVVPVKGAHWEKMKGTTEQAIRYASKEDTRVDGPWFYGVKRPIELKYLKYEDMYDWQKEVVDLCKEEPDDRSIRWYWEPDGGVGKSALVRHLCIEQDAIVMSGKAADMKYGIAQYAEKNMGNGPRVVIFDVPRSNLEYLSYTGIEEIKNGTFYSSKYESGMVLINPPHVLVFANEPPKYEAMSADRWRVQECREGLPPPSAPPPDFVEEEWV